MSSTLEIRFRLSVWRPAILDRTYLYGSPSDSEENGFSPLDQSRVLEQIYAWDAGPHDVLSGSTLEISSRIERDLLDRFAPHRPPRERGVPHFQQILKGLLNDPQVRAGTRWSDCQETVTFGVDDEMNLRANVTLGVLCHFLWVARVFSETPEASVLIR